MASRKSRYAKEDVRREINSLRHEIDHLRYTIAILVEVVFEEDMEEVKRKMIDPHNATNSPGPFYKAMEN